MALNLLMFHKIRVPAFLFHIQNANISNFYMPPLKTIILLFFLLTGSVPLNAQKSLTDSVIKVGTDPNITKQQDEDLDYDELFSDFALFLDSMMTPRSYVFVSVGISRGHYDFAGRNNILLETSKKFTFIPTLAYYHKKGLGLTVSGNIINENKKLNPYQFSITPSYDYIQNRDFATGISFTRHFIKDSLTFYTSPLQNELFGYFSYRKWWIRPSVAVSYGWGSRSAFEEREDFITSLRLRRIGYTTINSHESVSDFSIITSLRHDFYWLEVLTGKDHIRFSPQINFTSGTQKFGFNQSYESVFTTGNRGKGNGNGNGNVQYSSDEVELNDKIKFQPLSLSLFLRGEYSIGKIFLQPALLVGYYLPATEKHLNSLFSVNAGVMF